MANQVRIVMTEHGRGEVFVDGVKLDGVRVVEFTAAAGGINCLKVTQYVYAREVEIDGPANVEARDGVLPPSEEMKHVDD